MGIPEKFVGETFSMASQDFRNFDWMNFLRNIFGRNKADRPNLPDRLFWDWKIEKVDWRKRYIVVIDRVISRGNDSEWVEVIRFYGRTKVIRVLKTEINYLPDYVIDRVCNYFNLKREELACYERKQSRKGPWI
jgi:hypothetical protein